MYYLQKYTHLNNREENIHSGNGLISRRSIFREFSNLDVDIQEWILKPGVSEGDHIHDNDRPLEEIYYILEGCAEISISNDKLLLYKDDSIMIPPNISHSIENKGDEILRFLIIWGISNQTSNS